MPALSVYKNKKQKKQHSSSYHVISMMAALGAGVSEVLALSPHI